MFTENSSLKFEWSKYRVPNCLLKGMGILEFGCGSLYLRSSH